MAALLTPVIGAAGIWAGLPWLFPSLPPTIVLQDHQPLHPSARIYSVIMGHAAGIAGGVAGVPLPQAGDEPSVPASNLLTWSRSWGWSSCPWKAPHPPAAATALLITLGDFSVTGKSMLVLACGILLVAILGEAARRVRE